MINLIAALIVFILLHSLPANRGLRQGLISALGQASYTISYAIVSILVLVWVFWAAFGLSAPPLWGAAPWQAWVTIVLTPIGLFFLIAGLFSRNPLSVTLLAGGGRPGAIVSITRHPTLWGFAFWSGAHMVPNGEIRWLVLFGVFFVFSLLGMPLSDKRALARLGDGQWRVRGFNTSIVPFAAIVRGKARLRFDATMGISLGIAALLTVWLLFFGGHLWAFGADPLAVAGV